MLNRHAARIAFLRALNQLRSERQDVGASFARLARALWWLLDACVAASDVGSARMAMVMAETFFHVPPCAEEATAAAEDGEGEREGKREGEREGSGRRSPPPGRRVFVQSILRAHAVWRVEGFWEEVFYASVFEAIRTASVPHGGARGAPTSPPAKGAGEDDGAGVPFSPGGTARGPVADAPSYRPGSADWCYAYEQTIFSNLLAIAMNMATFGARARTNRHHRARPRAPLTPFSHTRHPSLQACPLTARCAPFLPSPAQTASRRRCRAR
jgi:hypothetical protein